MTTTSGKHIKDVKMNWKEFLKPDWKKIVVFVVLFIISIPIPSLFPNLFYNLGKNDFGVRYPVFYLYGTPFGFYYIPSPVAELTPEGAPQPYFDFMGFIGNVIFWYLLSCLIIWIYDKFRKVKKK